MLAHLLAHCHVILLPNTNGISTGLHRLDLHYESVPFSHYIQPFIQMGGWKLSSSELQGMRVILNK